MKKIDSTREIKENTLIRVYKKGFGYSLLTTVENTEFILICRCDRIFTDVLQKGDTIECYLWLHQVSSYEFTTSVVGTMVNDIPLVMLAHTDNVIRNTGRRCLKAEVDIPLTFFTFSVEDSEKNFYTEETTLVNGTIRELSDREAVITCNFDPGRDYMLKGHIILEESRIDIICKIEAIHKENDTNRLNVSFVGLNDDERNRIMNYVFSTYRE
ncbi:MAG: hypothetical protein ACOCX9_00900 [Spirochaetota bacterium]